MQGISARPVAFAVLVMSLGAVGVAACGSSSSSSSSSTPAAAARSATATNTPAAATTTTAAAVTGGRGAAAAATLTEYKIAMAPASVPAGHVTFDVRNTGRIKHQFTVIRTDKSAATVLSRSDPNDDIPGARGEIATIAPGASKTLVIKHLKPGHYALVCALPGHYQSGMHADFTVR
jgi:uncharacterized cupredoxin-like copper-binding protein